MDQQEKHRKLQSYVAKYIYARDMQMKFSSMVDSMTSERDRRDEYQPGKYDYYDMNDMCIDMRDYSMEINELTDKLGNLLIAITSRTKDSLGRKKRRKNNDFVDIYAKVKNIYKQGEQIETYFHFEMEEEEEEEEGAV